MLHIILTKSNKNRSKRKIQNNHDLKHLSSNKGHGSTGGVESSQDFSEIIKEVDPNLNCFEKLNSEIEKNMINFEDQEDLAPQNESESENNEDHQSNSQPANFSDIHKMHMIQTLQGLLFIRSLAEVSKEEINRKKVYLPPPDDPKKKKVIVFDLDETLVH